MLPVYKVFSTPKGYYMYDRSTNTIVKITREESEQLKKADVGMIAAFKTKGYLDENIIERVRHPALDYIEYRLNTALNHLIIQLTQNCNLRCTYCPYVSGDYQRRHSNRTATLETIRKGVDFLLPRAQGGNNITFGFYGGEPLLEMPLLKNAVKYVEEVGEGREISFHLTTNGTLLSDEVVEYLIEKDVSVLLSLDGTKENHDINRVFPNGKGSFDIIMARLERIKDRYPDFFSRIMINSVIGTNVDLSCTNEFFNADQVMEQINVKRSLLNPNATAEKPVYSEGFKTVNSYEQFKVFLNMLGRISINSVSKLYYQDEGKWQTFYKTLMPYRIMKTELHPGGSCQPGITRLLMDVNGFFYPCERVNEQSQIMRIGHVDRGIDPQKVKYLLNVGVITEQECIGCFAFHFCRICCAQIDGNTALSRDKKLNSCESVKESVVQDMKVITILRELGYDFQRPLNGRK